MLETSPAPLPGPSTKIFPTATSGEILVHPNKIASEQKKRKPSKADDVDSDTEFNPSSESSSLSDVEVSDLDAEIVELGMVTKSATADDSQEERI